MQTIKLQSYGIVLTVDVNNPGAGKITSELDRHACPYCGEADCCFSCDESQAGRFSDHAKKLEESEEDVATRLKYNGAIDGIEAMVLAHACADVNVTTPAYLEGIETAYESAVNNTK